MKSLKAKISVNAFEGVVKEVHQKTFTSDPAFWLNLLSKLLFFPAANST